MKKRICFLFFVAIFSQVATAQINNFFHVDSMTSSMKNALYISKSSSSINVYVPAKNGQYICYPLVHKQKDFVEGNAVSHYDTWGIENVFNANYADNTFSKISQLFMVGEAEVAIRYIKGNGDSYWVGGRHGNEMIDRTDDGLIIDVDNTQYNENDLIDLKQAEKVFVRQQSLLYVPLTIDSVFGVLIKEWTFSESGLKLSVKIKFLENSRIAATYLCMVCLYRHLNGNSNEQYLSRYAYKDNESEVCYVVEDDWERLAENANLTKPDKDCYCISIEGDNGFKCVIQTLNDTRLESGGMFLSTNNNKYNKIYTAHCYKTTMIQSGDSICAVSKWTLDWEPSEISDVKNNIVSSTTTRISTNAYDLSGHKINKPQNGIFIVNGKKHFFK